LRRRQPQPTSYAGSVQLLASAELRHQQILRLRLYAWQYREKSMVACQTEIQNMRGNQPSL
jgi:hypothetical protein